MNKFLSACRDVLAASVLLALVFLACCWAAVCSGGL